MVGSLVADGDAVHINSPQILCDILVAVRETKINRAGLGTFHISKYESVSTNPDNTTRHTHTNTEHDE